VTYDDLVAAYRRCAPIATVEEYGRVVEAGRDWPLLRLTTPGERVLLITSGFHGEEPCGPITLANYLPALIEEARGLGLGLRVYPCINPSGFEVRARYNASGEKPNNDFLRYELAPGVWRGELRAGESFVRWVPFDGGPQETRALQRELPRWPVPVAALDIHQDRYLGGTQVYAYTFGDAAPFRPLIVASGAHAHVATNTQVDEYARTDADGLIPLHDGSVTDYFHRLGVKWTACLETTTLTSAEACDAINLIWIRGFMRLAADG